MPIPKGDLGMKIKTAVFSALCAVLIIILGSVATAQAAQKPTLIGFAAMSEKLKKEIGPVINMRLTMHKATPLYRADIVVKGEKLRVYLNALTGAEVERDSPRRFWGEQEDIVTKYNLARGGKGDPIAFGAMALKLEKEIGPILHMKMVMHRGEPLYAAVILTEGKKVRVRYDALTGHEVTRSYTRVLWGEQEDIATQYILSREGKADPKAGNKHEGYITPEKAREIALNKVGVGTVKRIALEHEHGVAIYEVEVHTGRRYHIVKIDATKGTVVRHTVED